jgi:hypothetical protein
VTISISERPPLGLTYEAHTPSGKMFRWASDAPDARDKPSGATFSSTMPGGYAEFAVTLPRKSGDGDADLERLTTIQARGAGGAIASESRLERAPRVTGDQINVSPSAVGWQAHLADDKSARFIGMDRDLGRWQGPSRQRLLGLLGATLAPQGGESVTPDATTGAPAIQIGWNGAWNTPRPISEFWYDAGDGNQIGALKVDWEKTGSVNHADPNWLWNLLLSSDDLVSASDSTGLSGAGPSSGTVTSGSTRRFARLQLLYNVTGAAGADGALYAIFFKNVRVVGNHGLAVRGSAAATEGLLASDLVAYIVRRWAPLLNFTQGVGGTIEPSDFAIPQFAYPDPTNSGELVRQATRFGLQDWAVWDNKTFYWHERGAYGRNWRARSGPTKLEETGPQIDRLWESVIVQYRDVDGSTRTVGPPGSGAGTEDARLKDIDPDNPANRLGIVRRDMLQAGTLTAAGAIELGRRFLAAQKTLDSSGRATITGHIQDDRGVLHPYWRIRAGDTISFTDAADTSPRRIVSASHATDSYSCTVDLDSPPDGMDALLERLGVVLVPLGA